MKDHLYACPLCLRVLSAWDDCADCKVTHGDSVRYGIHAREDPSLSPPQIMHKVRGWGRIKPPIGLGLHTVDGPIFMHSAAEARACEQIAEIDESFEPGAVWVRLKED